VSGVEAGLNVTKEILVVPAFGMESSCGGDKSGFFHPE
jgi:hypothetical protein